MFYTGYADLEQSYPCSVILRKPASAEVLLATMADLIAEEASAFRSSQIG
jgi:hypothetical protein